jgi:hypothetical protein
MNSNYQINNFYAQERVNAQLKAAEVYRRSHKNRAGYRATVTAAAARAYSWLGQVSTQVAHSLETLGKARVTSFDG